MQRRSRRPICVRFWTLTLDSCYNNNFTCNCLCYRAVSSENGQSDVFKGRREPLKYVS